MEEQKVEVEVVSCEHVAAGELMVATIPLGEGKYLALCVNCIAGPVHRILADAASVLAATLLLAYKRGAEAKVKETAPVEYPTKEE